MSYYLDKLEDFFEDVTDGRYAVELGNLADELNYPGIECVRLFDILRNSEILDDDNRPYQEFIDMGLFRTVELSYVTENGDMHIIIKTLVFQEGIDFVSDLIDQIGFVQDDGECTDGECENESCPCHYHA